MYCFEVLAWCLHHVFKAKWSIDPLSSFVPGKYTVKVEWQIKHFSRQQLNLDSLTVPCTALMAGNLPAIRAVQGDCQLQTPANWRPYLKPNWQSYDHQAKTV